MADLSVDQLGRAQAMFGRWAAQSGQVRQRVVATMSRAWNGLDAWREPDIAGWVDRVAPVLDAGQVRQAALTDAALAAYEGIVTGETVAPVGVPAELVATEALRAGRSTRDVLARVGPQVWSQLAAGRPLPVAVDSGLRRGVQIASTDLQLAKTHASRHVMRSKDNVAGYRRVLTGRHSCGLCIVASTQRYRRESLMPVHPACVPSGALVALPSDLAAQPAGLGGCEAATRRRYAGPLVVLSCASGQDVTVTPNHPVLTGSGWVPAGLIGVGDHLARRLGGERMGGRGPDERHRPTPVEQVWRSLSVAGLVSVPVAAEDFHGDGSDDEVDVVRPLGHFPPVGDVCRVKGGGESRLVGRHGLGVQLPPSGASASLFGGYSPTPAGLMRRGCLGGSLLRRHTGSPVLPGCLPASQLDAVLCQVSGYGRSPYPGGQTESKHGFAGQVALDDFMGWVDPFRAGPPAGRFDAPAVEFLGDGRLAYARQGSRLLDRLAGQVELDCVVEARRVNFAGHVYNLQTTEGWYSAEGVIVSNCDCSVAPILGDVDPGQVIDPGTLAEVHEAIGERFGAFDSGARNIPGVAHPSGRPLQYRDVLVTHEHGELGPVLGVRGQRAPELSGLSRGHVARTEAKRAARAAAEAEEEAARAAARRAELEELARARQQAEAEARRAEAKAARDAAAEEARLAERARRDAAEAAEKARAAKAAEEAKRAAETAAKKAAAEAEAAKRAAAAEAKKAAAAEAKAAKAAAPKARKAAAAKASAAPSEAEEFFGRAVTAGPQGDVSELVRWRAQQTEAANKALADARASASANRTKADFPFRDINKRDSARTTARNAARRDRELIAKAEERARRFFPDLELVNAGSDGTNLNLLDLASFSDETLRHLARSGVSMHIGDGVATDFRDFRHLAAKAARGHEGGTLSGALGFYQVGSKSVVAGGKGAGVVRHETGHALDFVSGKLSNTPRWRALHGEAIAGGRLDPYYAQPGEAGLEEYFAQAVNHIGLERSYQGGDPIAQLILSGFSPDEVHARALIAFLDGNVPGFRHVHR